MNKKNICKIMLWENIFVAAFAVTVGLLVGIALSKAAELMLYNLLGLDVTYNLSIGAGSLGKTVVVFTVI